MLYLSRIHKKTRARFHAWKILPEKTYTKTPEKPPKNYRKTLEKLSKNVLLSQKYLVK